MKKRFIAGIATACLLVPTTVLGVGSTELADKLFGSSEQFQLVTGGTSEDYTKLEAKLTAAKEVLEPQDFVVFQQLLENLHSNNMKIMDKDGSQHVERLNKKERQDYEQLIAKLEPYFEQLNNSEQLFQILEGMNDVYAAKIKEAEALLEPNDFAVFYQLFEKLISYNNKIVDQHGELQLDRLNEKERQDYEQLMKEIEPYFEQLNSSIILK